MLNSMTVATTKNIVFRRFMIYLLVYYRVASRMNYDNNKIEMEKEAMLKLFTTKVRLIINLL